MNKFCGHRVNHELHKNIIPQKFGAIRYLIHSYAADVGFYNPPYSRHLSPGLELDKKVAFACFVRPNREKLIQECWGSLYCIVEWRTIVAGVLPCKPQIAAVYKTALVVEYPYLLSAPFTGPSLLEMHLEKKNFRLLFIIQCSTILPGKEPTIRSFLFITYLLIHVFIYWVGILPTLQYIYCTLS